MDREVIARRLYETWVEHQPKSWRCMDWDEPNMERERPIWRLVADEALAITHRETLERTEHELRRVNAKLELLHAVLERKRVLC